MLFALLFSFFNDLTIREIDITNYKYREGDCVAFDQAKFDQEVDGTPMLIMQVLEKEYKMLIIHPKVEDKVYFYGVVKNIDETTKKIECPAYLEKEK